MFSFVERKQQFISCTTTCTLEWEPTKLSRQAIHFFKDHDICLAEPVLCDGLAIWASFMAPKRVRERGWRYAPPLIWFGGAASLLLPSAPSLSSLGSYLCQSCC